MHKSILSFLLTASLLASSFAAEPPATFQQGARKVIDLNGTWEIRPNQGLSCNFPPAQDGWKPEKVPQSQSSLLKGTEISWSYDKPVSDFKKKKGLTDFDSKTTLSAWYRRNFAMPTKVEGKTVTLTFDYVLAKSVVWLNGVKIGECVTGNAPTSYDITSQVRWGAQNDLVVWVAGTEALVDLENEVFVASFAGANAAGILSDVRVEIRPSTYIDDVYVKTSVMRKRVEVEMTVTNKGKTPANVVPSCVIERHSDRRPSLSISGEPVTLAAGEEKTVVLSKDWENPVLWSPSTPFLYVASCQLSSPKGGTVDGFDQRFGFREFQVKGKQFLLNGQPITLFRDNAQGNPRYGFQEIYGDEDPMRGGSLKELAGDRFNNYRIWGNNPLVPQMGDEIGVTLAPTLSVYWSKSFPLDKQPLWLPNIKEHLRKVVKNMRNHPSIVIWNMTNETYWGEVPKNPVMKQVCKELVDLVRSLDNTRPLDGDAEVTWDGLLDITSIHYPGAPGEVSKHYPNSGVVVPNDLYWLKEKGNVGWRADFDWDRPLSLGEYSMTPSNPDAYSGFGGEEAYDWVEDSMHPRNGVNIQLMNRVTDVYRVQGVACVNPWIHDEENVMPRFAIRPLDFHPNLQGGKTASRKVAVFYESDFQLTKPRLHCLLAVDGRNVWETNIPLKLKHGANVVDVPISAPQVTRTAKAELTLRLIYDRSGFVPEKMSHSETVFIMPEASLANVEAGKIALLDPSGKTATALAGLKLTLNPLKTLDAAALSGKKLLLVSGDAPLAPAKDVLLNFAEKGGSVVFLQRESSEGLGSGFPELDKRHVASRIWKRSHSHPALDGLEDGQLSYWRPDNMVGKLNFTKPTDGDFKVMMDAGGMRGMEWTPLLATGVGDGHLIFSQLSLLDRLTVEPAAGDILSRLIRYGITATPDRVRTLRLLAQDNAKLEEILGLCRIGFTKGLQGDGPVLWDASYKPSPEELTKLKTQLEAGGKVWMHGFTPENVGATAALLPFAPALDALDPKMTAAVRMSNSPLMDNLSSADFLWAKVNLWHRGGYLEGSVPTAKLGSHVLRLPALDAAETLIEPGLLVAIPVGKGTILFDTLGWADASASEGERVVRIVSALAMNQGAKIAKPQGDAFEYFAVDLAKSANMGYVDEVADDGQGGWLDMGTQDLCFFLTNHTERIDGTGAPIAVDPFPENSRLGGVPFQLTAPKKNNGKSVIALRGNNRALKLPDKVEAIAVGHKADKLWFIHAANYIPAKGDVLAKYLVHYEDGTTAEFPVRSGIEINDWSGPVKPERAKICWTGNNRINNNVGVYLTEWSNPSPAKLIKSIDVVGALTGAQLGVIGIAGGVAKADAATPLARWDFAEVKEGKVADSVGGVILSLSKPKDAAATGAAELDGTAGLKLDGRFFTGSLEKVAGFDPEKPFIAKIAFSLVPLKEGEKGYGIFEACAFGKSGFRLMVDSRTQRLVLEFFPQPDGTRTILTGKTSLEMNQIYNVAIVFDAAGARLYLNNKLEVVKSGGMPKPYKQHFMVGNCSGAGQLFGTIQSVELCNNGR